MSPKESSRVDNFCNSCVEVVGLRTGRRGLKRVCRSFQMCVSDGFRTAFNETMDTTVWLLQ